MDRPALAHLLADIRQDQIDCGAPVVSALPP
jgi:hypothetical protein